MSSTAAEPNPPARLHRGGHAGAVAPGAVPRVDKVLGYGLALAALWYFGGLLWRLKKGTAGVKPVEDLVDRNR